MIPRNAVDSSILRVLIVIVTLHALVATPRAIYAEDGSQPTAPIALKIDTEATEIVAHQPLLFTVTLSNESDTTISVTDRCYRSTRFIARQDSRPFALCAYGKNYGIFNIGFTWTLPPGRAIQWDELLFWRDPDRFPDGAFVFAKPGRYELRAEVEWPILGTPKTVPCQSNTVSLTVRPPTCKQARAMRQITRPDVARYLQHRAADNVDDVVRAMTVAVARFPRSPYSDQLNFALGVYQKQQAESHSYYDKHDKELARIHILSGLRFFSSISPGNVKLRNRGAHEQLQLLLLDVTLRNHVDLDVLQRDIRKDSGTARRIDSSYSLYRQGWPDRQLRALQILYTPDARLDTCIKYEYGASITYGDVLKSLSAQSGIPLDTAEDKERPTLPPGSGAMLLREWLSQTYSGELYWERRGRGYFLVRDPISRDAEAPSK